MAKFFLTASAVSGFLSVALGAFAAHGLKNKLDEYSLGVFHKGVEYQFYHTFALALVGMLLLRTELKTLTASGYAFMFGTVVFSGSLYILAFSGQKFWGAITPIGGLSLLAGWVFLTIAVATR